MDELTRTSVDPVEQYAALQLCVGRANRAYLTSGENGCPSLYLRGLRYGVDDFLPNLSVGRRSSIRVTAGEFVCRQMHRDFGHEEDRWPALARQFLTMHAPRQSGRTAEEKHDRQARDTV
jgi:hypothetical protein